MELIRIRLQTQPVNAKLYNGPIDCIRKIYQAGGFKSLYRGLGPTIGREGHGMGFAGILSYLMTRMYFLTYETLIHRDTSQGINRKDIPEWKLCLYGALYVSF